MLEVFPADWLHCSDCHHAHQQRGTGRYSAVPAFSQILERPLAVAIHYFNRSYVTSQHARCMWFAKTTRLRARLLPAYRYAVRTVSSTRTSSGAWRAVSEDSLTSNNSMIESSEYLRLIAPPSFMSRRIARISSMPSLDTWRPS